MRDRPDLPPPYFLCGGGDMGRLMREHDWSMSPLGPPHGWSQSLQALVAVMLNAKQPMFIASGPQLAFLYNDGYAPIFGLKHPDALGRPFAEVWSDIWDQILPLVTQTMSGMASFHDNLLIPMTRHGYLEDAWFSFSYTPIRNHAGEIEGMFCAASETTREVLSQRLIEDENKRLEKMFKQAPGFMAILNGPEHRVELVNEAYLRLIGHRPVVGRKIANALPEIIDQGYIKLLDEVYESGNVLVNTGARYSFETDAGTVLHERVVDFVFQPLTDKDGRVTGIFVEGSDVTERTRAEEALYEARALAESQAAERAAILAHLAEGVIVTDNTGRITFVNEAASRLHGVALLDVPVQEYSESYHLFTVDNLPYPSRELPLARAVRGEIVTESRWRIRRPDGTEVLAIGSARPVRTSDGHQSGAVLTLRDDTDREAAERLLRENEARLRALTDNLPSGMVYQMSSGLNGEERRFLYVSQSHEKLTGVPAEAVVADPMLAYEMILPVYRRSLDEAESAAIRDRKPFDIEVQFERPDGKIRWCRIISAPRQHEDGSLIWDGIQIDITDQKSAEAHLHLLINELNHRVKNSLATVQSIASQTFRDRDSIDEAKAEFTARIIALAKAHDVLTEANWSGAGVREIVKRSIQPHNHNERINWAGPEVTINSKGALALSMALHELCTNAAKYGALSTQSGAVEVAWSIERVEEGRRLRMLWTERGGPRVVAPVRKGFGSRLLEYALAAELDGEVQIEYRASGVVCVIDAPLPALA